MLLSHILQFGRDLTKQHNAVALTPIWRLQRPELRRHRHLGHEVAVAGLPVRHNLPRQPLCDLQVEEVEMDEWLSGGQVGIRLVVVGVV